MKVCFADVDEQVKSNEVKTAESSKVHIKGTIVCVVFSAIPVS